jgi:hypothetical protein
MKGWRYESAKHSLAARGIKVKSVVHKDVAPHTLVKHAWWKTNNKEDLKMYVKRNVDGHEKHGLEKFEKGVGNMARHPIKDLDGEWKEYTSVASNDYYGPQGQSEKLSRDKYERTVQRGSALVGRIVTQANVEPIIDKNQDRSFRDIMLDIEFGRRT